MLISVTGKILSWDSQALGAAGYCREGERLAAWPGQMADSYVAMDIISF